LFISYSPCTTKDVVPFSSLCPIETFPIPTYNIIILNYNVLNHINHIKRNKRMNTLKLKGNWNETAGKLKQQYANLTDDDLLFEEGKEEELLGRLQAKVGKTKEQIRKIISKI
jgi:uncharacterized protein YjbJ (UPF0337 family)